MITMLIMTTWIVPCATAYVAEAATAVIEKRLARARRAVAPSSARVGLDSPEVAINVTVNTLEYRIRAVTPGQLPPGILPPGQLPLGQLPPDDYPPRTITPRTITPRTITPGQLPPDNYHPELPPIGQCKKRAIKRA